MREIVWLLTIGLGRRVFVAITTDGYYHTHDTSTAVDIEVPLAILNSHDRILLYRSHTLIGKAIRLLDNAEVSHAELLVDAATVGRALMQCELQR